MTKARTLADNFAADINGITAGTGITGGGTSGTVTITNQMATTIDAKGDLVVGTGADTFGRLAVASTAGYVLTVDSAETTGLKWAAPAAGGKVLQVVQGTSTTQTTIASQTLTDTGLSASITPSSTSSKVLVSIVQSFYLTRLANSGQGAGISLLRGSTSILNLDGSGTNEALFIRCGLGSSSRFDMVWLVPITYLDSPSTTSSVTYKTQAAAQSTADTGSISAQFQGGDSVMILMEIGA